jgi:hypothetical protein
MIVKPETLIGWHGFGNPKLVQIEPGLRVPEDTTTK